MQRPCNACLIASGIAFVMYLILFGTLFTETGTGDTTYYGDVSENLPFVFIGGIPRSGAALLGVMLDLHPDVRCGKETGIITRLLKIQSEWRTSKRELIRLQEAGVNDKVLDSAIASFIVQIIVGQGAPAPLLCNKDPFTMYYASYLAKIFPNARFIFVIRDGRPVVHSIISREITNPDFNFTDYREGIIKWNKVTTVMDKQCKLTGKKCLRVFYEQLVLNPERQMHQILEFLKLPRNSDELYDKKYITDAMFLAKMEWSRDEGPKQIRFVCDWWLNATHYSQERFTSGAQGPKCKWIGNRNPEDPAHFKVQNTNEPPSPNMAIHEMPMTPHNGARRKSEGGILISSALHTIPAIKPINTHAQKKNWIKAFPKDVLKEVGHLAPMLWRFGYINVNDVTPPDYGELRNTLPVY